MCDAHNPPRPSRAPSMSHLGVRQVLADNLAHGSGPLVRGRRNQRFGRVDQNVCVCVVLRSVGAAAAGEEDRRRARSRVDTLGRVAGRRGRRQEVLAGGRAEDEPSTFDLGSENRIFVDFTQTKGLTTRSTKKTKNKNKIK
jgi:hypothetical protein